MAYSGTYGAYSGTYGAYSGTYGAYSGTYGAYNLPMSGSDDFSDLKGHIYQTSEAIDQVDYDEYTLCVCCQVCVMNGLGVGVGVWVGGVCVKLASIVY